MTTHTVHACPIPILTITRSGRTELAAKLGEHILAAASQNAAAFFFPLEDLMPENKVVTTFGVIDETQIIADYVEQVAAEQEQ